MTVSLSHYLILAAGLFSIGLYGVLSSRNLIRVLFSVEIMLNAVNLNLIAFNRWVTPESLHGQAFSLFVMTVAAAEAGVALAIVISLYRNYRTVDLSQVNRLKW